VKVAFQGELGAFSELAIAQLFNGAAASATPVPCREFTDVVNAVETGAVDAGVLPIYNTTIGDITAARAALDPALNQGALAITDDAMVPIHPYLLACEGTRLQDIREVSSHPAALAQCAEFLAHHPEWSLRPAYDTAGAARDLATSRNPTLAVLASSAAAHRYALTILQTDVADRLDNATQFVTIRRGAVGAHSDV
jgi:prephenate dehydratase